ncbi:MAG: hypothetical protein ACXABY_18610 [Candidatus Thorarchaeota archaeon]|jgi:hypothetical protein
MANKVYINPETKVRWTDFTGDETFYLSLVGAGAGRNGDIHDWGAAPRAGRYHFKFVVEFDTPPVVGETVRLYIREAGLDSTVTDPTNDDGPNDTPLSSEDKLRNLMHVGTVVADIASANVVTSIEGTFETDARWFGPVVFNDSAGDALDTTEDVSYVDIWPVPDELQ